MKRKGMAASLEDFSPREIASIERRLFMKRGLSLGALTLLSGCNVTEPGIGAESADGDVALERPRAGLALRSDKARAGISGKRDHAAVSVQCVLRHGRGAASRSGRLSARNLRASCARKGRGRCPSFTSCRRPRRSRAISASKAGAPSASGAACGSAISCSASAPTRPRNTSASSAPTTITRASTCRRHCIPRRCSRSGSPTRSCRGNSAFPMKLRMPTKLGFKNPKHITALFVTNDYPGGYWEDQGYNWYSGS